MSDKKSSENDNKSKSFWGTFPGILTAVAAIMTALAALIGALSSAGLFDDSTKQTTDSIKEQNEDSIESSYREVGSDVVLVDAGEEALVLPEKNNNVGVEFSCKSLGKNAFATVAQASNKELVLINWTKHVSSGESPEQRCQKVTQRFQNYSSVGALNYLTTGRINGQNVICTAASNGDCNRNLSEEGLLFTITSDKPPSDVLLNILDLGLAEDVPPINESTGDRIYVIVDGLLTQSGEASSIPLDAEERKSEEPRQEEPCFFGAECETD